MPPFEPHRLANRDPFLAAGVAAAVIRRKDVMGPSDMFQRLPDDVLCEVLMRASFGDALRLSSTCRAACSAPAIAARVDAVQRNLDRKRALMKELRMPWGFTSPRSLFYPAHACLMSEQYVLITTERWTTPDFTPEAARESFNLNLALDPADTRCIILRSCGTEEDLDVTLLRLAAWFPDVCRDVTCLKVQDISHGSVRDRHLAPFTNARVLQVWDCDRLTDAAPLQFTHMDSLKVIDCPGITGACISPLVTDHELYCIEYWSFHIGSEPHHVFIAPSAELQYLVSSGALQIYMTTEHMTYHVVHFWKYNPECHIQKCKQAPLHISCKARA